MTQKQTPPKSNPKEAASDVVDTAMAELNDSSKKAQGHIADEADKHARDMAEASAAFDNNPFARQAAEQVSSTLTQFADAVRDADLGTVQRDMTDFARRSPALFFGGAAVLGFVVGRALKASERAEDDHYAPYVDRAPEPAPSPYATGNHWGRA